MEQPRPAGAAGTTVVERRPGGWSAAEVAGWLRVHDAVWTAPPASEPPWSPDGLERHLTSDPPDEPQVRLLALAGGPEAARPEDVLGYAVVGLPVEENADVATAELAVHPDARRRGVGTALLRAVVDAAEGARREHVIVEVVHDEGRAFADRFGLAVGLREVSSVLALAGLDRSALRATVAAGVPGYRLAPYRDRTPPELLASHARARGSLADAPLGELAWTVTAPSAARWGAHEAWSQSLGVRTYGVLAIDETSGEVAAYTELTVAPWNPRRAEQGDTAVVAEHRGRGLARLVKSANLLALLDAEPQTVDVDTWNGDVNAAMRHVNERLGFRPASVWDERQAPVARLRRALGEPSPGAAGTAG